MHSSENLDYTIAKSHLSKATAASACIAMASVYVASLYAPCILLRLPPPASFKEFMLRRFASAAISSIIAFILSLYLLVPQDINSQKYDLLSLLGAFGFRCVNMWQAIIIPLTLTGFMYLGPLVIMMFDYVDEWKKKSFQCEYAKIWLLKNAFEKWKYAVLSTASDILAWRNYFVAPLTEELVFRACMVPLLLCGGFRPLTIIFFCPIFFGLAHLNHFWELSHQQNQDLSRAALIVGLQLVYTTIFGWYASFLFIRTGHLSAPVAAHIFCNLMGLPSLSHLKRGSATIIIYLVGIVGFLSMLVPATDPRIYANNVMYCKCWSGYCEGNLGSSHSQRHMI